MRDSSTVIYPPYHSTGFLVMPADKKAGRGARVIVGSGHAIDQAFQVAFLEGSGKLVGEYWHSCGLYWFRAIPSTSGAPLLLTAGVNHGERRATIVALDPFAIVGPSTPSHMRDQRFRLLDMPESREEAVILFPRTCLSREDPYNRSAFSEVDEHVVRAKVVESYNGASNRIMQYEFDHGLKLRRAFVSSNWREEHLQKEQAGLIRHLWREDDEAELAQGLEYRRAEQGF